MLGVVCVTVAGGLALAADEANVSLSFAAVGGIAVPCAATSAAIAVDACCASTVVVAVAVGVSEVPQRHFIRHRRPRGFC